MANAYAHWQSFRPELQWAYAGPVNARTRHLLEIGTHRIKAWLLTRGHVRLLADGHEITVRKGHWVFFCGGVQKHDFSPSAAIISVCLRVPEGTESFWRHSPITTLAARHPELEKMARKLIAAIDRIRAASSSDNLPLAKADDLAVKTGVINVPGQTMTGGQAMELAALGLLWSAACIELREKSGQLPEGKNGRCDENSTTLLGEKTQVTHPKLRRVLMSLTNTPLSDGFSEARLAGMAGMSIGHLDRLFVRTYGKTPRRLWEQYRRDETARRLLQDNADAGIKQIAFELGFGSPSHFSNWFRNAFGTTPRAWRNERLHRNA